ncbi:Hypothetical protein, putative, partial [Bodo saltans]
MITVAFTDACTELLVGDWQAACRELTTIEGATPAAESLYFDRPVTELYHIIDSMFSVASSVAAASMNDDFALSRSATTDFAADESATFDVSRQLPYISARWQRGTFPLLPLDRDEVRPLREALPPKACAPSDAGLEFVVSMPLAGGATQAAWSTTIAPKGEVKMASKAKTSKFQPKPRAARPTRPEASENQVGLFVRGHRILAYRQKFIFVKVTYRKFVFFPQKGRLNIEPHSVLLFYCKTSPMHTYVAIYSHAHCFGGCSAPSSHVIILEDDMRVSHDFLEMFESLAPILEIDPTVWCISSWNDNGFRSFELPTDRFFRSSYFPGLGWMLKRSLWVDELSDRFPEDNWDHW